MRFLVAAGVISENRDDLSDDIKRIMHEQNVSQKTATHAIIHENRLREAIERSKKHG